MPALTLPRKKTITCLHPVQNTLKQEGLFLPVPEMHGQNSLVDDRKRNKK